MSWNVLDARVEATEFTGYEKLEDIGKLIKFTQKCDKLFFVFDRTPFYGEAGGQAGDSGIIEKDGVRIDVENCVKQDSEIIHIGKVVSGGLSEGDFLLKVDHQKRRATERNHTATHLLHKVLKNILGEHVNQAGSRVEAGRFRFDFTHFKPLSRRELDIVEEQVNGKIIENLVVKWEFHSFENAKKMGATALFGEKYGDVVRVVQVVEKSGSPFSMELCGGTHVSGTGSIGSFRIVSEGSAASGVRRIEALTGFESLRSFRSDAAYLIEASELLKCKTSDVPLKITDIFKELDEKNRELSTMRQSSIAFLVAELIAKQLKIAGVHVISGKVDVNNVDELRACADMVREKIGSGIAVLGAEIQGKASFVAMVTRDLILSKSVKAGEIVREVAKLAGGGGGGADHLAVAGAKDASKLDIALNSVKSILEQRLSNTATNLF
jgi:alanyl-tRNA synthetase